MGSGRWDSGTYRAAATTRAATGTSAFHYTDVTMSHTPRSARKAHDLLSPLRKVKEGPREGQNVNESLITDEHPNPTPISVWFDVTGSMGHIPRVLQEKLPNLLGVLLLKGYLDDPQISFGAIGDAYSDVVPVQVAPFESDNRLDEHLGNIYLEGGGGGGNHESYELFFYALARKTYSENYETNGHKGYAFLILDEANYSRVEAGQVKKIFDDDIQPISIEEIIAEAQEKFEVFVIIPTEGGYRDTNLGTWKRLVGEQNAIALDKADAVCETIAMLIGSIEGYDTGEITDDLKDVGSDLVAVASAANAVATAGVRGRGGVATVSGGGLTVADDDDADVRL
jgi:hypothetical protein